MKAAPLRLALPALLLRQALSPLPLRLALPALLFVVAMPATAPVARAATWTTQTAPGIPVTDASPDPLVFDSLDEAAAVPRVYVLGRPGGGPHGGYAVLGSAAAPSRRWARDVVELLRDVPDYRAADRDGASGFTPQALIRFPMPDGANYDVLVDLRLGRFRISPGMPDGVGLLGGHARELLERLREALAGDSAEAGGAVPEAPPADTLHFPGKRNDHSPAVVVDESSGLPLRPGDGMTPIDRWPVVRHKVRPAYPEEAHKRRIEGFVIVDALVGADGRVRRLDIRRSIRGLNGSSAEAVAQTIFSPALAGDRPVAIWVPVQLIYRLDESGEPRHGGRH